MSEFGEWDGQSPPTARTYRGKDVVTLQSVVDKSLPNFGPYAKEKRSLIAEENGRVSDLLGDNRVQANRPAAAPDAKVPTVQEVIGRALDSIGTYNDLDNRCIVEPVFINLWHFCQEEVCLNNVVLHLHQATCGGFNRP